MGYKREFIDLMIDAEVLTFGDFVTKSGRKTPYFINTGNYRTGSQMEKLGGFYADCIAENIKIGRIHPGIKALFGPAYKGIPLAVSAAMSLFRSYNMDVGFFFNRKETKDHGEGGSLVGYEPKDGDRIIIIEDVITAGTAIKECMPILKAAADVKIEALVISVDRMEKGKGSITAIEEINEEFNIPTFPIVNIKDIIDALWEKGTDQSIIEQMKAYLSLYGVHRSKTPSL